MIALLCAISDLVLICAGIFGGSALLMQSPWLMALVTGRGRIFTWYGFGALKTAMSSNLELASAEVMKQGRWKIIATMLAVTWLNPHVYPRYLCGARESGGNWTLSLNAGLHWEPSALRSCGSSVWHCWRHGWHRVCELRKHSASSIRW